MRDVTSYAEDGARRVGAYRWPIVEAPYTRWSYVTALVVDPRQEYRLRSGVTPTEAELAVVESFHQEYMSYWYRQSAWFTDMRASHLFDVDGGANTRYLMKLADGNWTYRLRSWEHGPWPFYDQEPMDLLPLLDHIHSIGGDVSKRWVQWKQQHDEVFAAVTG